MVAIPFCDIGPILESGIYYENVVRNVGDALKNFGFVALQPSIPYSLVSDVIASAEEVFKLPQEILRKYIKPEYQRQTGYTPFALEKALTGEYPDLKHFWQVRRSTDPMGNYFPSEVPNFGRHCLNLFDAYDKRSIIILRIIAIYLGLDLHFFDAKIKDGLSVMRVLEYLLNTGLPGVPSSRHTDINLITLMVASNHPGLKIVNASGDLVPVGVFDQDTMIVNVGDMLSKITENIEDRFLPSTEHQVDADFSVDVKRFVTPFFAHPQASVDLGRGLTAGGFLQQRLKAIGVA